MILTVIISKPSETFQGWSLLARNTVLLFTCLALIWLSETLDPTTQHDFLKLLRVSFLVTLYSINPEARQFMKKFISGLAEGINRANN